jgi:hypothetical protein
VLGAVAFGLVYAAERQFASVAKDLARYDRLRAMSGDKPFLRELMGQATQMIADFGAAGSGEARDLFGSLTSDLVRYATMRRM